MAHSLTYRYSSVSFRKMEQRIHILLVLISVSMLVVCQLLNPTAMTLEQHFFLFSSVAISLLMGYGIFAVIRRIWYDRPLKSLVVKIEGKKLKRTMAKKTSVFELSKVKHCQVVRSRQGEVCSIVLKSRNERIGFVHLENMDVFWEMLRKAIPKSAKVEQRNVFPTYLFFLMGLLMVIVTEIADHSSFETMLRTIFCAFLLFSGGFTLLYRPASRNQPEVKSFERWVAAAIAFGAILILVNGSNHPTRDLASKRKAPASQALKQR